MRRLIIFLMGAVALLVSPPWVRAQDLLVPAGTLLQCTLDEPNFSSATASVGDPILCHLKSFQEFGRTVFPRGSMLAGHLEAEKEPGHFVGKGYMKIAFDRVIVPSGDVPLPAKLIHVKGYKVDKQGDIKGNGHAKRDLVEWMIPPLWPWKVLTLPARGPRPTLEGEEPIALRLMDDVMVPRNMSASASFGHLDRPPYASSNEPKPSASARWTSQPPAIRYVAAAQNAPAASAQEKRVPAAMQVSDAAPATIGAEPPTRMTILVLKSNQLLEVAKYRIDNGVVLYQELNGKKGAVDSDQIDWRQTTQVIAQVRSVDVPVMTRQTDY